MLTMESAASPFDALAYVTDPALAGLAEAAVSAGTAPGAEAVAVYLNHGRWVVECPICRPGSGAQLACASDRRYLCHDCGNAAIGGLWRPTTWPDDPPAVEGDVVGGPVETRNWSPDPAEEGGA